MDKQPTGNKINSASTFLLRRASSLQKQSSATLKLPKLKEEQKLNITNKNQLQRSLSPKKEESPIKRGQQQSSKNVRLDKLQLILQDVTIDAPYDEAISARAWAVYSKEPFSLLRQYNYRSRREMASLTKMMTFLATIKIARHFSLDLHTTYFRVTLTSIDVTGTLAQLELGEWLNLYDLLQGLMLPSGNDCSNVIAENLGAMLFFDRMGEKNMLKGLKSLDLSDDYSNIKMYVDTFVKYMNNLARENGMKNTVFCNPHGLSGKELYSTAEDMAILSSQVLKYELAEKFITCKSHEAKIKICNNNQITIRPETWQNTNKLLEKEGYKGIKTGYTPSAGGCLATYYVCPSTNAEYIVVVLGCKSQEARFSDTEAVLELFKKQ